MSHWRRVALTTIAVALTACGGSADGGGGPTTGPNNTPTTPTPPTNPGNPNPTGPVETNQVTVTTDSFSPGSISVPAGTTVTWEWNSCSGDGYGGYATCVSHSILFDDGATSPTLSSGTFSRVFQTVGTYKYHCVIHGTAMSGQVTVK